MTIFNLKRRKKEIENIYDSVCDILDDYYKDKNLCEFDCNRCLVQRKNNKHYNGCCRKCVHWSATGCKTRNITCKFYYCYLVKEKNKILTYDEIALLNKFSFRQRILIKHNYFSSREEIIIDLLIGSLLIGAIRIIYRQIRNAILFRKYKERI